jgi:long-chain fatty acid transport protein
MRQTVTPLLLVSLGLAGTAHAAGFAVDTQSARATGMAAAVTGGVDDSSAIFYNPAGIANGKSLDAQIGITPIFPSNIYEPSGGGPATDAITGAVVPPTLYVSTALLEPLAFGIGVFAPYGLALTWPNPWAGQYLVTHSELTTLFINPTVAVSLSKALRIGVGFDIVRGTVKLNRNIAFPGSTGAVELGGGAWGEGFNVGVQASLSKAMSLGLTYRGTVSLPFTGSAHFSDIPPGFATNPQLQDQNVSTTIVLPQSAQAGLTIHPSKMLTIGADVVYTGWQSISDLNILFEGPSSCSTPCPTTSNQLRKWTHTFNYHLGAEWALNDAFRFRLGGMYDPTPIPASTLSPDLPDSNRVNLAVGAGYRVGGFTFDVGYQLVILTQTTSTLAAFPAQYHGTASLLGITVGFQLSPEEKKAEPPPPAPGEVPAQPPAGTPAQPPPETTPAQPPAAG